MDPRIVQVLATIRGNHGQCLRVSQLAALVGLGRSRLEHLLKAETGQTLKSLSRSLRLKRAQSLLADYALRIKEVGSQCGYPSTSYFDHDFKKTFHISPSEYRRSANRQQIAHFIN
ncbi:MAG: helix-turn-helix transcriptional regulator [Terriglobia bacterium]